VEFLWRFDLGGLDSLLTPAMDVSLDSRVVESQTVLVEGRAERLTFALPQRTFLRHGPPACRRAEDHAARKGRGRRRRR